MINALVRKLGLDRIGDMLADEIRRAERQILEEEREVLAKMIARLDERIAGLGGKRRSRPPKAAITAAPPPATRKPRRKPARVTPKPGETLKDFVVKVLTKAGGLVKVTTLVDLVLEAGYKTNAKRSTLVTSTYTVLTDKKLFRKMGKGVFGLVAAPAAPQKAPTAKAPSKNPAAKNSAKVQRPAKEIAQHELAGETLQLFVLRVFGQARRPMRPSQVAKRVKALGYQTMSSPEVFLFSVERVLADGQLFRIVGKGLYELALPSPTRRKVRRPRKPAKTAAKEPLPAAAEENTTEAVEEQKAEPTDVKEG